ncbi:hypothetical protein [Noviluteimonas gilva]|uniref:Uncharacterized protein n=1 Tax=Noviluteimonas gilva TaxID=2682097 RepID=A0A7C9M467_9GAMM|nr:hypothetical protein [Lysobacter gilvus]MUV14522.1 hypothetical protein [Lysobacter gilvus]
MRPPIIIDEHGDVSVFESVEAAARYIEPIDVRNNEYVAYDSAGYLLRLVPTEPRVSIPGYASDVPQPAQLAQALRTCWEQSWGAPVPAEVTSLDALLALFVSKHGYTK